jgi:hypothetical protein
VLGMNTSMIEHNGIYMYFWFDFNSGNIFTITEIIIYIMSDIHQPGPEY